jgi:hypothetical protein
LDVFLKTFLLRSNTNYELGMHGFIQKLLTLYYRTIQCQQLKRSFSANQGFIPIDRFQANKFQDTEPVTNQSFGRKNQTISKVSARYRTIPIGRKTHQPVSATKTDIVWLSQMVMTLVCWENTVSSSSLLLNRGRDNLRKTHVGPHHHAALLT